MQKYLLLYYIIIKKNCVIFRILEKFTNKFFFQNMNEVCKVFNWNKYDYYL